MKIEPLINALTEISTCLNPETIENFKKLNDPTAVHHSLGRHLRNKWNLWQNDTDLTKWFDSIGIFHGDDRSAIILDAFLLQLNNKPVDSKWVKEQVKFYKNYWKTMKSGKSFQIVLDEKGKVVKLEKVKT